jgi:dihydroorotase
MDLRYANVKLAVQTVERNRDVILGVKVRLSRTVVGDHDLAALRLAREAAEAAHLPLMVHVGDTASTLPGILRELRPADVVTHVFHGWPQGILDERGRVLPEVRRAVASGVRLDVGHGRNSFSWRVAEAALAQGILPDTISSDLHQFNVAGPVFDLATTLSKFLHLGMTVEQVVERSTTNAARLFRFPHHPGTLRLGAAADIAIFRMIEGDFETADSPVDAAAPETRHLRRKLLPVATIKDGRLYGSPSIPGAP